MDAVATQVQENAKRVVILQLAIAAVTAVVWLIVSGTMHGAGAFFGGLISVSSSLLLRRGVVKAAEISATDPKRGMIALYMGAVQRFVLILVLFGIALGGLDLEPLATVTGFLTTQLVYVVMVKLTAKPGRRKGI